MNTQFKHKKSDLVVQYLGPIEYISDDNADNLSWRWLPKYEWLVQLYMIDERRHFVMPLLEFINTYEPITKPVDDIFEAVKNNIKQENEGHTEDIHTLHSGESEIDSERPAE